MISDLIVDFHTLWGIAKQHPEYDKARWNSMLSGIEKLETKLQEQCLTCSGKGYLSHFTPAGGEDYRIRCPNCQLVRVVKVKGRGINNKKS